MPPQPEDDEEEEEPDPGFSVNIVPILDVVLVW